MTDCRRWRTRAAEILPSSTRHFCLIGADAGHLVASSRLSVRNKSSDALHLDEFHNPPQAQVRTAS